MTNSKDWGVIIEGMIKEVRELRAALDKMHQDSGFKLGMSDDAKSWSPVSADGTEELGVAGKFRWIKTDPEERLND